MLITYRELRSLISNMLRESIEDSYNINSVLRDYLLEKGIQIPDAPPNTFEWFGALFNIIQTNKAEDDTLVDLAIMSVPPYHFRPFCEGLLLSRLTKSEIVDCFQDLIQDGYVDRQTDQGLKRVFQDIIRYDIPVLPVLHGSIEPIHLGPNDTATELNAFPEGRPVGDYGYDPGAEVTVFGTKDQIDKIENFCILLNRFRDLSTAAKGAKSNSSTATSRNAIDAVTSYSEFNVAFRALVGKCEQVLLTPENFTVFKRSIVNLLRNY